MNSRYTHILHTLTLTLLCLLLGPKAARAYEILGHAGWSVSADTQHLLWSNPSTKVYRENTRDARQLHIVRQGNRGGIMYVNKATGGCLLAHAGHNGAGAGFWGQCNPNDPKMNWYREHVGGGDHRLRNVAYPSQCLDAAVNQEGGNVHMWQCLNVPAQRFRIVPVQITSHVTSVSGWSQLTLWNGYSLKTNHDTRFTGQYGPVIGLWDANVNDNDQDFRFEAMSDGGYMLRQSSLSKCLDSTNNLQKWSQPIVYPCDVNNANQRWEKVVVPGGQFLLRRKGTNLCLDSTGQDRNGQKTHLWTCEGNNQNQRFKFGDANKLDAFYDYEVWLVARKAPTTTGIIDWEFSPGHAFIGLVGRRRDNGQWAPIRTYSFWPNKSEYEPYQESGNDLTVDYKTDFEQLQALLRGQEISARGHAVRKARIVNWRAASFMRYTYRETGCIDYRGILGIGETCNCMDYSTRLWYKITGGREDFRFGYNNPHNYSVTPDVLVINMNYHTWKTNSEFVGNGSRY